MKLKWGWMLAASSTENADSAGWPWEQAISVGSAVLSVAALVLAWISYRQRVRYHAQPKFVFEWAKQISPVDGLFLRQLNIVNHGDAPARDLVIAIEFAAQTPWGRRVVLHPGEDWTVDVPLVNGVKRSYGGGLVVYEREGDPSSYRMVTPHATLAWRQAPFARRPRRLRERAPRTPNLLAGKTE